LNAQIEENRTLGRPIEMLWIIYWIPTIKIEDWTLPK
jgi:hypothetical protein